MSGSVFRCFNQLTERRLDCVARGKIRDKVRQKGKVENKETNCNGYTNSFIHYRDLYSASSRLLFRSAPDPCTAKRKSFEARVECVRKNPGEQSWGTRMDKKEEREEKEEWKRN